MNQNDEMKLISNMLFERFGAVILDTKQVASVLGMSEITLKQNRGNSIGIPYVKLGKSVKYKITGIAKFITENTVKVYV